MKMISVLLFLFSVTEIEGDVIFVFKIWNFKRTDWEQWVKRSLCTQGFSSQKQCKNQHA